MNISYNSESDLLYLRFDDKKSKLINKRVNEDIVLDIDENERIVGIEILNASERINLNKVLPVTHLKRKIA
ncbi:MAG: DUF2283 domain-containing protein [Candidatus Wallbacteria bacterium]|nr:DUF2283 domain-containing protein [Candidatus Wallbacteria bacterium]